MPPADGDRPSISFSFSPPPTHTRPASSCSSSDFSQPTTSTRFAFSSPVRSPTNSFNFSSSSPRFSFNPPSTSSFAFSAPSSAGSFHSSSVRTTQSSDTPSGSSTRIFTPPSEDTTTSTIRAFSTALDIGAGSPQAAEEIPPAHQENPRGFNLSPNVNVSTYRDLYNASPSPQPSSFSGTSQANTPSIDSLSSSHLGSVTSGVRNLIVQSIETPSTEGEESNTVDVNSDFGSEEGSDDDNSAYSVRGEELPQAPIYDAHLQNSLREVRGHLADLVISMERYEMVRDETTNINDLYKQVKTASEFEYPETRIVGFIGDSGVGKSTLINSLLHHEGLARSNGNGEACTSVVTEFRHIDEAHMPYTIEVDFMNVDETKELLQELLRAYRMRHTRAFDEVADNIERDRVTSSAARALGTLQSLFPNEEDLTEELLSSEEPHAEDRIITCLEEWALAGLNHRPGGPDTLHQTITAQDIYECRENIDIFTVESREPGRPALWPFVKLIRVYLKSLILRTGLVVADLPGFRDLNYARVRATEQYLRHVCDEVFVVSAIGRCRSDPSIRDILDRRVRGQPLRIVCTKSESDINAEESIRDPAMSATVKTQARQLLERTKQVNRSLATMTNRRRRSSGAHREQYAVQEANTRDELETLDLELKRLLIEARNELVITSLSNSYQPDVRVFCVSSKLYEDHCEDYREQATEYIQLSGIPELRRYCQSVPAEAQLRATSVFLKTRVPAVLGSLNQWILAGSNAVTVDRAATLRRALDEAQSILQSRLTSRNSCIRSIQMELTTQFNNSIISCIRNSRQRWKAGAIRASRDWRTMHHSSYAAFCRKYGVHKINTGVPRCWNNEILEDASEELDESWSTLLEWIDDQQDTTEAQIGEIFNSMSTLIEEYTHLAPEALENLLDNLETQKQGIADTVEKSLEDLLVKSTRINRDALDGHTDSSYIARIMRPAYNACNAESGGGSDVRRKNHMDQHVRDSQIFPQLSDNIKSDYVKMIDDVFTELRHGLHEEVRNITRDLGIVIAVEGEVTEAGQEPELAQRVRDGVSSLQTRLNGAQLILSRLQEGAAGRA